MTNRLISASALMCVSLLLISSTGYACNTTGQSILEHEKTALSDLAREGAEAHLYNFRSRECMLLNRADNELEVTAFLPSDETSLGIYQLYRDRGESQIDALKHTLEFTIAEQQG